MPMDFSPLDERVRSVEISQARTDAQIIAMAADVSAIRERMEKFGDVLDRLNTTQSRAMTIIAISGAGMGAALPYLLGRLFGGG